MIYPVVLCGGSGTRLWPLSRKGFPKQFSRLTDPQKSLFEATLSRLQGPDFAEALVVTGPDFRFLVAEQMQTSGSKGRILLEPAARNTAPAILAAALHLAQSDPEALILVAPSDHVIPDTAAFQTAVRSGVPAAQAGRLVTFGITPTAPETGYGWLECEGPATTDPVPLTRFVEKPDAGRAAEMLAAGNFLWNAGIFLFRADALRKAFEAHAPQMIAPVEQALAEAVRDLDFLRLAEAPWQEVASDSIDYAVMERADNLTVVPFSAGWNDLGSWSAVADELPGDSQGVVTFGAVTAIDCKDSLLRSESPGLELVGIGVENLIAVAMPDAVLVADRSRAQDVKLAVDTLRARGVRQAEKFSQDQRPWGHFETLALGERFQVKRIVVKPGAALSLQSHVHRAEHWIVVSGTARITVGEEIRLVTENQSIYVPLGAKHRLENPGKVPMVLIEVQTGAYLGEDDIIRYEDLYARGQGEKG